MNFVAERIEQLRAERGWTVYKLAQESGLSETCVHRWIGTLTYPTIPALMRVCDAFCISLSEFFSKGDVVEVTGDKMSLYKKWCSLSQAQQKSIVSIVENFLTRGRRGFGGSGTTTAL
jgi:transcriptional regulator with XRE-family HTH domain